MAALRRSHAAGGVTFHKLHVFVAIADGIDDIGNLQIFVEVHKLFAVRMREYWPWKIYTVSVAFRHLVRNLLLHNTRGIPGDSSRVSSFRDYAVYAPCAGYRTRYLAGAW